MGRFLVMQRVHGVEIFVEWSTIVDAPITGGMTIAELKEYYRDEYGRSGLRDLELRITGPRPFASVAVVAPVNRAGEAETRLTVEQLIDFYFARRGEGDPPRGESE